MILVKKYTNTFYRENKSQLKVYENKWNIEDEEFSTK
jgi:hypothetical protein